MPSNENTNNIRLELCPGCDRPNMGLCLGCIALQNLGEYIEPKICSRCRRYLTFYYKCKKCGRKNRPLCIRCYDNNEQICRLCEYSSS